VRPKSFARLGPKEPSAAPVPGIVSRVRKRSPAGILCLPAFALWLLVGRSAEAASTPKPVPPGGNSWAKPADLPIADAQAAANRLDLSLPTSAAPLSATDPDGLASSANSAVLPSPSGAPELRPDDSLFSELPAVGPGHPIPVAIEQILRLPFPASPGSRSALNRETGMIDGIPAKALPSYGGMNRGIYSLARNGQPRIIKVLYPLISPDEFESDPPAPEQMRAGLIGALFGAPKLHRAGVLQDETGQQFYFLEMDELFPGQPRRSLKEILKNPATPDTSLWLSKLHQPGVNGRRPTQEIADRLVEVLEHRIIPRDRDFMIAENGGTAWLDTNRWVRAATIQSLPDIPEAFHAIRGIFYQTRRRPEAYQSFYVDFLTALKRSRGLPEATKNWLLRRVFDDDYSVARRDYGRI